MNRDAPSTSLASHTGYAYERMPAPDRDARIEAEYVMEPHEPEPSPFFGVLRPARVIVHRVCDKAVVCETQATLIKDAMAEAWKRAAADWDQREAARELVADGRCWGDELKVVAP